MPFKDKEKQKISQAKSYLKNKERRLEKQRIRRQENKTFVWSCKKKCAFCKETNPACLDFHHLGSKTNTIAQLIRDGNISSIKFEIAKCITVCSNCHRKIHSPAEIIDGKNWTYSTPKLVEKRKWFIEYKKTLCCNNCFENDIRCLEFHHIKNKRKNISKIISNFNSLDFLKEEISRCIVLCSNCHRKEHNKNCN